MRININKKNTTAKNFIIIGIILLIILFFTINNIRKSKEINLNNTNTSSSQTINSSEEEFIKSYIRSNISKLAPEKTALGGSWYVVTIKINIETKRGTFIYEDGHIRGTAEFKYTKSKDNLLAFGVRKIN